MMNLSTRPRFPVIAAPAAALHVVAQRVLPEMGVSRVARQ
jgi:hypothetical protein